MVSFQSGVARRAKVSQSTVSRALRNDPALPASTCRRIQAIARDMGYAHNPLLSSVFRALRGRRSEKMLGTLAFLTAHSNSVAWKGVGTYRDFFEGARDRAADYGFILEHHWAADPSLSGKRLSEIFRARGIMGIIVGTRSPQERIQTLGWDEFALVKIGVSQPTLPVHCVVNHQYRTLRMVAGKLFDRGYRRIGLALSRWQNEVTDHNWIAGFLVWQQSQKRAARVPAHIPDTLSRKAFAEWRRAHQPDAVIAVNSNLLGWLRDLDRGGGNSGFALLDWHEEHGDIAGADQNNRRSGAVAVDLLMAQLRNNEHGIPPHPQTVMIESRWHEGKTADGPDATT